mmetsp:Transcript_43637/g.108616  ORF Transcript_43637/g.108616 Transcript_43637/m.108616 type:complete len:242 (-) Transcript_43637:908-1633(-)
MTSSRETACRSRSSPSLKRRCASCSSLLCRSRSSNSLSARPLRAPSSGSSFSSSSSSAPPTRGFDLPRAFDAAGSLSYTGVSSTTWVAMARATSASFRAAAASASSCRSLCRSPSSSSSCSTCAATASSRATAALSAASAADCAAFAAVTSRLDSSRRTLVASSFSCCIRSAGVRGCSKLMGTSPCPPSPSRTTHQQSGVDRSGSTRTTASASNSRGAAVGSPPAALKLRMLLALKGRIFM